MNAPTSNDVRESEEVLEKKELASEEDNSSKAGETLKEALSSDAANTPRRKRTVSLEKECEDGTVSEGSHADDDTQQGKEEPPFSPRQAFEDEFLMGHLTLLYYAWRRPLPARPAEYIPSFPW